MDYGRRQPPTNLTKSCPDRCSDASPNHIPRSSLQHIVFCHAFWYPRCTVTSVGHLFSAVSTLIIGEMFQERTNVIFSKNESVKPNRRQPAPELLAVPCNIKLFHVYLQAKLAPTCIANHSMCGYCLMAPPRLILILV